MSINDMTAHNELPLPEGVRLRCFNSREEQTVALAEEVMAILQSGIKAQGRAAVAFSGGRTPIPLFQQLRTEDLNWAATQITLADDRCLPLASPDSNAGLITQQLLQEKAAAAEFIPLWLDRYDALSHDAILADCQARLDALPELFDLVILGMGNDGHTASLFPCSDELDGALTTQQDCALLQPTTAPWQRLTLTPHRLLRSRQHILHLCGEDKLNTLTQALQPGTQRDMPIRIFLSQPLTIYWNP
ncbi:6-phosphogluconolactonase [Nitrincola alkalilacustris]|uniref:6-phosphogluconolactonase n=1 Tax=Nitrincola alkalilacustris TaxID=1571224 RepID=UPI00145631FF|nr:6-phosphogluconolactonase [Nitrincola alkalilacustris]